MLLSFDILIVFHFLCLHIFFVFARFVFILIIFRKKVILKKKERKRLIFASNKTQSPSLRRPAHLER